MRITHKIGTALAFAVGAATGAAGTAQATPTHEMVDTGELSLDVEARTLWRGARQIELMPKEFALFAYLAANAGTVVSRAKLLSNVWGMNFDPGTKVVEVYIRYIRQKLQTAGAEQLIRTVRGFGYVMRADDPLAVRGETGE